MLQPEKVRDGTLCAALAALKPDVLVVAAYGRILGKDLLTLAPHGAINVHGSLLPRYRGAAPIQWAVANGEPETGVTIMQMDEGLDSGDMLLQRALPIGPADTAEALSPRLAALGGEALVEALALLTGGEARPGEAGRLGGDARADPLEGGRQGGLEPPRAPSSPRGCAASRRGPAPGRRSTARP